LASAKQTETPDSFVTDLAVGADNVVELAACGRARWKIENETFNVLKNKGYNLEHCFGHGKHNLAAILVSLNLLAFAFHTVCDIGDELWRGARDGVPSLNGRKRRRKPSFLTPKRAISVRHSAPATTVKQTQQQDLIERIGHLAVLTGVRQVL
jgi:hypothetical protein